MLARHGGGQVDDQSGRAQPSDVEALDPRVNLVQHAPPRQLPAASGPRRDLQGFRRLRRQAADANIRMVTSKPTSLALDQTQFAIASISPVSRSVREHVRRTEAIKSSAHLVAPLHLRPREREPIAGGG